MSIMATETQQVCAYVHHRQYPTQHVLRVFFEDFLDHNAPTFGARIDELRHRLSQLKKLQIHVYDHRVAITWWAPQSTYRPAYLRVQEARLDEAQHVVDVLASLLNWPTPPYVMSVSTLEELFEIERDKNLDWGLGSKTT